jgi:hypothetical protein
MTPTIYHVTPQQVGQEDLQDFLRRQIQKQFEGKDCYVSKELIEEKVTHYSPTPRKLRGFLINEGNNNGHAIWFDVTDCQSGINWLGR